MGKSVALNVVVALLALATATNATDEEVVASLVNVYGTAAGEGPQGYFASHGKKMFEQASMLEAMALAKLGKAREASDVFASLAIQTFLADLPPEWRAAGDLLNLLQSNRFLFKDTIATVQRNQAVVSQGMKTKLTQFQRSGSKTSAGKQKVKKDIQDLVASQGRACIQPTLSQSFFI